MDQRYEWFDKKQVGGRKQYIFVGSQSKDVVRRNQVFRQATVPHRATVLATFTTHPLSPENLHSEFLSFTTPKQTPFTTPHDREMVYIETPRASILRPLASCQTIYTADLCM
jgi:hypothetical protein